MRIRVPQESRDVILEAVHCLRHARVKGTFNNVQYFCPGMYRYVRAHVSLFEASSKNMPVTEWWLPTCQLLGPVIMHCRQQILRNICALCKLLNSDSKLFRSTVCLWLPTRRRMCRSRRPYSSHHNWSSTSSILCCGF